MRKVTKRLLTALAALLLAGPALAQQLPADVPNVCVAPPEYVGRNAGGGTSSPYVVIDAATGDTLSRHNDLGNAYESANAFTFTRDSVRVALTHLGRCPEHLDRFLSRLGYELVPVGGTTPPDSAPPVPPDTIPTPPDTIPAPPDSTPGPGPGVESLAIVSEDSATATLQAAFSGSPTVVGARSGPTATSAPVCPPFRTGQSPTPSPATSVCQRRSSAFDVYAVIEEGGATRAVGPVTVDALPRDTTTNPGPGPGPGPITPPPSGWPAGILPPQTSPDTLRPVIRRTVRAGTAAELQAAIAGARPGDEILLTPGGRYSTTAGFALPPRNDGGFAVIRTDISHPMVRVDTTANLADITCTGGGCAPIRADQGGDAGWRVELVRVTATAGTNAAIRLHQGGTNPPRRFVFDRIHVRSAGPTAQLTRAVLGNAASFALLRSVLPDAKGNQDTQAFVAWNTPGPILLYDNLLGGAGENILIGGADPASAAMLPQDIVIARNHVWKDPAWRGQWVVKNLLELKIGLRIHIWGNEFENHWRGGQQGYCVLFKTANQSGMQDGGGDFSETGHVYFERNVVRNCDMGFNLARLPQGPGVPMHDVLIENVICERLGPSGDYGGADSQTFLVQGPDRLTIRNTTCPNPGGHSAIYMWGDTGDRFDVDGLVVEGPTQYGLLNQAPGWGSLSFRGWSPNDNCSRYPPGWSCSTPPAGTGADTAAVRAATAGVVR